MGVATPFKMAAKVHVSSLVIYFALVCCVVVFLSFCFYGAQLGVFGVYLAKSCVSLHHKFSRLSTIRDMTWTLYK